MSILRDSMRNPFAGVVFKPVEQSGNVGVIVVPGSDGGIPESIAERIAKNGYPALALGYFRCEGRPSLLEDIDLEYFKEAVEAFKGSYEKIVLLGYSRGGELALILGAFLPDLLDGIIAFAPSSNVNGGFPHPNRPAWHFKGQPLPFFHKGVMSDREDFLEREDLHLACKTGVIPFHQNTEQDPYVVTDLFLLRNLQGAQAKIPVENIRCPLLIVAGEQDKIWPSARYCGEIRQRLDAAGSTISRKFLIYPEAGHGIIAPYEAPVYHPWGGFWCALGGTPASNQQASESAWIQVMELINQVSQDGYYPSNNLL